MDYWDEATVAPLARAYIENPNDSTFAPLMGPLSCLVDGLLAKTQAPLHVREDLHQETLWFLVRVVPKWTPSRGKLYSLLSFSGTRFLWRQIGKEVKSAPLLLDDLRRRQSARRST